MMAGLRFHFCFLVLCASLIIPTQCLGDICLPEEHVALFIFGDSLFDAGNNNYINTTTDFQANIWPYGETFFKYPTGRFSDGRMIPDFIAEYAKLPLIPPYLHPGYPRYTDGANFASGGAGALVKTRRGFVIDLHTQLSYFKKVDTLLKRKIGEAQAKKLLSKAIYLFSIGTNDYFAPFLTNTSVLQSYSHEEYVDMVIGNVTTVIEVITEIHRKGGRKFGFLSLAPLGFVPITKAFTPENREELTALVTRHNKAFSHALQILASQLKGFKYSYINLYSLTTERMNNPLKYGFKEGMMACCGTGPYRGISSCGGKKSVKEYELCGNASEYVFFDNVHPTERANQQLAKLFWNGNLDVTWPYNLKALLEQK